jgi:hypothetical protein
MTTAGQRHQLGALVPSTSCDALVPLPSCPSSLTEKCKDRKRKQVAWDGVSAAERTEINRKRRERKKSDVSKAADLQAADALRKRQRKEAKMAVMAGLRVQADVGDANAQAELSELERQVTQAREDHATFVRDHREYTKALTQGTVLTQFTLAVRYYSEPKGALRAVELFSKAAVSGYADAQFWLGVCCMEAKGMVQDVHQAMRWWEKAAAQVLPLQSCPHRAALTVLPSQSCPHSAALTELPSQSCPHRAALTVLPSQSCPHRAALTELPSQSCPHRAALTVLSSQCCTGSFPITISNREVLC